MSAFRPHPAGPIPCTARPNKSIPSPRATPLQRKPCPGPVSSPQVLAVPGPSCAARVLRTRECRLRGPPGIRSLVGAPVARKRPGSGPSRLFARYRPDPGPPTDPLNLLPLPRAPGPRVPARPHPHPRARVASAPLSPETPSRAPKGAPGGTGRRAPGRLPPRLSPRLPPRLSNRLASPAARLSAHKANSRRPPSAGTAHLLEARHQALHSRAASARLRCPTGRRGRVRVPARCGVARGPAGRAVERLGQRDGGGGAGVVEGGGGGRAVRRRPRA